VSARKGDSGLLKAFIECFQSVFSCGIDQYYLVFGDLVVEKIKSRFFSLYIGVILWNG